MDTFGCYGDGDGQFEWPNVIAWDTSGNMYVGDCKTVYSFCDCKGQFLSAFSTKGAASKQSFLVVSPSVLTSLFMCVTMGTNVCQCLRQVENL